MFCTIFCIIIGENRAFPVDIDNGHTVGDLTIEIKAEKLQRLATIDADALVLYQIDVDGTDEEYIKEVRALAQNLMSLEAQHAPPVERCLWVIRPPSSEGQRPCPAT